MGGFTEITLKDASQEGIDKANGLLAECKVAKKYRFYSEKDIEIEYEYYKKKDGNYPEDQFPSDKITDYASFREYWTKIPKCFVPAVGMLTFDCYYGRTSDTAMKNIGRFLIKNQDLIKECSGSYTTFLERSGLTEAQQDELKHLDDYVEPEMLPEDQRTKGDLQSGILLAKSWSPDPFWVLYGNVDSPRFMKNHQYVEDIYNDLYRDKEGRGFLLVPLMPLDAGIDWFNAVYEQAWNIGLREHPFYFCSVMYGVESNHQNEVTKQLKEFYTEDELKERFEVLLRNMLSLYGYDNVRGFIWDGKKFKMCWGTDGIAKLRAECQLLTILFKAMSEEDFKLEKYSASNVQI